MNDRYGRDAVKHLLHYATLSLKMKYVVLFLLIGFITGCAATPDRKAIDLVWPLPPDPPRIKFVDIIMSSLDLGKKRSVTELLFGAEKPMTFTKPYGVAVGRDGKIYVTDVGRVIVLDRENRDYSLLGVDPGTGQLRVPIGIASTNDGRIIVSDVGAARVYVYFDGRVIAVLGKTGEFESPSGVAIDEKNGILYVVDSKKHQVKSYTLNDYKPLGAIGKRGTQDGEFNYPTNIAVDDEGKLYVVDTGNFRVQVFDALGNLVKTIGQIGDTPGSLARPKGIAIDSEGHIYVVDAAFQNFQIFNQEGQLLLFVGSAGTEPGKFLLPAGIAIDGEDRIYVVDQYPGGIQIFQYLSEVKGEDETKTEGEFEE
jgi:DNA-binding beta-propeller fold protein YncE